MRIRYILPLTIHLDDLYTAAHRNVKFFFFNDTATTEIYTLSLHDALPIWLFHKKPACSETNRLVSSETEACPTRSEEHTSELQSHVNLVCRLLLEKKKKLLFLFHLY